MGGGHSEASMQTLGELVTYTQVPPISLPGCVAPTFTSGEKIPHFLQLARKNFPKFSREFREEYQSFFLNLSRLDCSQLEITCIQSGTFWGQLTLGPYSTISQPFQSEKIDKPACHL